MYFLSEEEKRLVLRKLFPQAREHDVHPDLRGWNWAQPPMAPVYEARLGIYEIAGQYCPTGRDVYLRRVEGTRAPPNLPMIEGRILHSLISAVILAAKRVIYEQGTECLTGLKALPRPALLDPEMAELGEEERKALQEKIDVLWDFEYHRIMARVQETLARQPYIGADALAMLALPVVVEQKLDGGFLGLSSHLSADALVFSEPMMTLLKELRFVQT